MTTARQVVLGLGSNLGDRYQNLNLALAALGKISPLKVSPVYETPALLKENSPAEWNIPYLNLTTLLDFSGTPEELLGLTQKIEKDLGRIRSQVWEPRAIDIDIIWFEGVAQTDEKLFLPHRESMKRAFVLDPLKDLRPRLKLYENSPSVLQLARTHPQHSPVFMAILNITPDSFSDGGDFDRLENIENYLDDVDKYVGILDIGAESTRPGAKPLTWQEEWTRLKPVLELLTHRYQNHGLRPKLSVDTRHTEVAVRALEYKVDIINDVSGLADEGMKELLKKSECDYVLMHSLSIPADKNITLPEGTRASDVLHTWFQERLRELELLGIDLNRIIIDPGIGFGKTADQSLELLANFKKFWDLETRILIGHSRKSFLNKISSPNFKERDFESVGLSVKLGLEGADILRVHNPLAHAKAWAAIGLLQNKSS